jgi:hypothetical protein
MTFGCCIARFWKRSETGKGPNVTSEILEQEQPGARTQVLVFMLYLFVSWFSAPLEVNIFTFTFKTMHFEQFWITFGHPLKRENCHACLLKSY